MPPRFSAQHLASSAVTAAAIVLLGCGSSADTTAPGGTSKRVGPPAAITLTSTGPASGPLGATLRSPFQATVTDSEGRAVSGVSVTFSIDSGAVLTSSATTDSLGIASTRVRLPLTRGTVTLTAATASKQTSTTITVTGITFGTLALGFESTCGVSIEGYAYCWGMPYGAITIPGDSINVPVPMNGATAFQSITVGGANGCGIAADSTAVCWGALPPTNSSGSTTSYAPPTPVPGGYKFRSLSRGNYEACGVTIAGSVYCWGTNYSGQIGSSTIAYDAYVAAPVAVDVPPNTFASVSVGEYEACALSTAGEAYCWGENLSTRVTHDDGTSIGCAGLTVPGCILPPAPVATSVRFASIAVGSNSVCGLRSDGRTYCWGGNDSGELGTGDTVSSATPRQVNTSLSFSQISGGDQSFCGLTAAGDVYCWGSLTTAIGIPSGTCPVSGWDCNLSPAPAATQGLHFTRLMSTEGQICGLANGVAYCWGYNWAGKLGAGTTGNYSPYPQRIANQP